MEYIIISSIVGTFIVLLFLAFSKSKDDKRCPYHNHKNECTYYGQNNVDDISQHKNIHTCPGYCEYRKKEIRG